MTAFNDTSKSSLPVKTAEHNQAAPTLVAHNLQRTSLPSPKGTAANVADSGRVRFGAGVRIRTSK
jgi:hypothetical protein